MNSRSQTKIRKIHQTNLLAEERYYKNKGLLNETIQGDIMSCLQTAAGLTMEDLLALAPCAELQQNPTDTTKMQLCFTAVIGVASKKLDINIFDPTGTAKKVMDLTQKIMACASEVGDTTPEQ